MVARAQLAKHCATRWPRDFYRDQTFSRPQLDLLLHTASDWCPWRLTNIMSFLISARDWRQFNVQLVVPT